MKRWLAVLLAGVLLVLAGCQKDSQLDSQPASVPTVETEPADGEEMGMPIEWSARYVRTNGGEAGMEFPEVRVVRSVRQLQDYYKANKDVFYLERQEQVYGDENTGFLDVCDSYDEAFFEEKFLLFVLLQESSGSVYHTVRRVEQVGQKLQVYIDANLPGGVGTCDMAQWHIILELGRDVTVESPADTQVYVHWVPWD